jgi:hypothetical protein
MSRKWIAGRLIVVCIIAAGFLVPSLAAPARTLLIPETIARSTLVSTNHPWVRFEFPPTHIAFSWYGDEGTGVRYRTTSATGRLSKWRRAPESHDAERGNHHFTAVVRVDRPIAVSYEPLRPKQGVMGAATLDYLNTADGPKRAVRVPVVAHAAAEDPTIVTRAEWGADESMKGSQGGCERRFFTVQQLFVHHTAGRNNDPDPAGTMRAIYEYHTQRQGWCDVGYNFVVGPDGTIFEGRWARRYGPWEIHSSEDLDGRAVVGAHVAGYNSGSVGVSVMGNFSTIRPSSTVKRALAELLAWEADRHDLDPTGTHTYVNPESGVAREMKVIAGHRAAGSTECPGNYLNRALGGIRRDTATVMGTGKTSSQLSLTASRATVTMGESVTYFGRLSDALGTGLMSRSVAIYQRVRRGQWFLIEELLTGLDGNFQLESTPSATTTTRAVFSGDTSLWGTQSHDVRVRMLTSPTPTPAPTSGG